MDKDFVAASIQAIGRCATNIGEVRDTCLNGLVQLLSNRDGKTVWISRWSARKCNRAILNAHAAINDHKVRST